MNDTIYGISYIYDSVGNRLADTDLVSGDTRYFEYDADNRMLRAGRDTFTFDLAGNMTAMFTDSGLTTYTWDYENLLKSISYNQDTVTIYEYNGEGIRTKRVMEDSTIIFLLNGYNEIAEYNEDSNIICKYWQTLDIDAPIAKVIDDEYYYYFYDGLGSVVNIISEYETIQNAYKYKGFGTLLSKSENIENEFQYTARRNDNNGLYYYRARYYNNINGRFVSKDLVKFENRFQYCFNNPVIFVDYDGYAPSFSNILSKSINLGAKVIPWIKAAGPIAVGYGAGNSLVNLSHASIQYYYYQRCKKTFEDLKNKISCMMKNTKDPLLYQNLNLQMQNINNTMNSMCNHFSQNGLNYLGQAAGYGILTTGAKSGGKIAKFLYNINFFKHP